MFFKKLEYRFLVESTKFESTLFPNKNALSEANVNINRMGNTYRPITMNGVLTVTKLFF